MTDLSPPALLASPLVQVRQRAKLFELRNEYDLFDADGTPMGVVTQVNQSPLTVVARVASDLDVMLPVELEIRDGATPVLTLRKRWWRMTVHVSDADGQPVGSIHKRLRMGKARFELLDAAGMPLGQVRAENWRAKDFAVVDSSEREVARVTKQWAGVARELFTDADHYVIQLPPELADPLRRLVLGAPFAIDLVLKQKDAG